MIRGRRVLVAGLAMVACLSLYLARAAVVLALVGRLVHWTAPAVPEIDGDGVARLGANSAVLIDVRSAEEFGVSHIPGAWRLEPGGALPGELLALPRDTLIIVYCSVGRRSAAAAGLLQAAGFSRVRNLSDGIFRWGREGRPLAGPAPIRIHGYSRLWRWLLPDTLRTAPGDLKRLEPGCALHGCRTAPEVAGPGPVRLKR